ncbi:pseudouridine synthase [Thiosulfatimonas sediminis]|uniref:Pseudouridine synthase n=1 Tax=Thiosulfatimonas sediminis TaxID=2675054 RepID=A0A6F8PVV4_9GAMM|nr:RluA family pseudouridine synthase [Thiosulfatimonas sediminis]BBP46273.1 pseudouridine synthase [Thiosulfatimonas sediminis]
MTQQPYTQVQFLDVGEEDSGQRLDNFLMRHFRKAPKALIYRIIRKGEVRVNKGRRKVSDHLQPGDVVRVPPLRIEQPEKLDNSEIPADELRQIEQSILFEDNDLIVVNKPSGVAVHGGGGIRFGLIEVLRALRPLARRLELVHRIDRDTSGCLLIAKKASVLKALHQQMRDDLFEKRYLAIVSGQWPKGLQKVDLPLKKEHLKDGGWHVKVAQDGKSALSYFELQQHLKGCDLMAVRLKTGRTHQIRVHALAQGCPLVGDDRYGDREVNKRYRKVGMKRLALHAHILGFIHPVTEQPMRFEAPLWSDFKRLIEELS